MNCKKKYDCYEEVLRELESFYGEIPNRRYFRMAVESKLTPEDCAVWLMFPKHDEEAVTLDQIRERDGGRTPGLDASIQKMMDNFFLSDRYDRDGVTYYARNYIFKIGITYAEIPGLEDDPMTIAYQDWFNAMVLGGTGLLPTERAKEFRVVPNEIALSGKKDGQSIEMDIEIPDTREVLPYDEVTELIKGRRTICLTTCNCRVNKDAMGTRQCDYPIETCMLFDELAERTLKVGAGREISVEEALEITKRGRDLGLVHNISNAKNPSVLCQCCACCCLVLQSMFRNEATCGKASRYVCVQDPEKCAGCGACADCCPAGAITMVDGKAQYDPEKCIGCGICVSRCKEGGRSLRLREDAERYLPEVEYFDVLTL